MVLGAVADRLIGGEELLELLDEGTDDIDDVDDELAESPERQDAWTGTGRGMTETEAETNFRELMAKRYAEASEPINLATLAHEVRRELGSVTTDSHWFGYEGFARALRALDLPGVRMSQHFIWDSARHSDPTPPEVGAIGTELPDPAVRVAQVLKLPALPTESWRDIFDALAAFVAAYEFNLSEATRWSRDRLADRGIRVARQAVGTVARGAAYGGCPLYRQPPPHADEIATAFVDNVLSRAAAADIDLLPDELQDIRAWFGAP
ncbi:MAG: hypothetical protein ACRDO4_08930 [Nocardioides sp.]